MWIQVKHIVLILKRNSNLTIPFYVQSTGLIQAIIQQTRNIIIFILNVMRMMFKRQSNIPKFAQLLSR